jgi:hypothetical protein
MQFSCKFNNFTDMTETFNDQIVRLEQGSRFGNVQKEITPFS